MALNRNTISLLVLLFFLISFTILVTNLFDIPQNAGQEYIFDKIFYSLSLIIFYLTAPFLISKLIRHVVWQTEFKNTFNASVIGKIEDYSVGAIYLLSLIMLVIKLFSIPYSFTIIVIFFIGLPLTVFLRPRLINLYKAEFVQSARPFKIGDRIGLLNHSGNLAFSGKVITFDAHSVQLRSENDTLLVIPNSQIKNFTVENYNALEKEIMFSVLMHLSSTIPIKQAKRILYAAARHALIEDSSISNHQPEIHVTNISRDAIEYKINFRFEPWRTNSPSSIKDKIFSRIKQHLEIAGIYFDYDESKKNILKHVDIFNSLSENELNKLYETSTKKLHFPEEEIIRQGEQGSSMYVLVEGLLKVVIEAKEQEKIKVGTISPCQFFGEMSLLTGEERSANVIAETESLTIEISKESLKEILEKKPSLVKSLGEIIAERQTQNLKMLDDYAGRKKSFINKIITNIKSFFNLK